MRLVPLDRLQRGARELAPRGRQQGHVQDARHGLPILFNVRAVGIDLGAGARKVGEKRLYVADA